MRSSRHGGDRWAAIGRGVALLVAIAAGVLIAGTVRGQSAYERKKQMAATQSTGRMAGDFKVGEYRSADGTHARRYAIFVPEKYDPKVKWPLVVFLHGSGECGTDGIRQTRVGLGPFIARHRNTCPFIALFPQGTTWFRGNEAKLMLGLLDKTMAEYSVDPDRVYLTGLSMGGFGTWELAMHRPDLFAAIVPICGGGPPELARNIAHIPVWCFHGAMDDHVPVDMSRKLIAALRQLGAIPKYTEFPSQRHECWDEAYGTKGLFPWMLAQKRPIPPQRMRVSIDYSWCPVPTQVWWLRIDEAEPEASAAVIGAEIKSPTEIEIQTKGVRACSLAFGRIVLDKEHPLHVQWQGQTVYEGSFAPVISLKAPLTQRTDGAGAGS